MCAPVVANVTWCYGSVCTTPITNTNPNFVKDMVRVGVASAAL
jgi:hypothetical protein